MPRPVPNGIGIGQVGVMPIGTQPLLDWADTVLSQYANSATLTQLVADFSDWIDPAESVDAFYDDVFNILTAKGYGLDVWGRIVGVNRVLEVDVKYFGFDEATTISADPFNQSPFFSGADATSSFALADSAFRALILAKALANICDGSVPGINRILASLFPGRGDCHVTDPGDMTMTYVFDFALSPVETAIVTGSGVLPQPAGVAVSYSIT